MTDFIPSLKTLAEASIAAGEFKPPAAWSEDRYYSPAEEAWLEFVAQATPQTVLALILDAARYRWLRDPDGQEDLGTKYNMPPIICGYAEDEDILAKAALDRAIDTGIEETKS